jgi:hypothetical protein
MRPEGQVKVAAGSVAMLSARVFSGVVAGAVAGVASFKGPHPASANAIPNMTSVEGERNRVRAATTLTVSRRKTSD